MVINKKGIGGWLALAILFVIIAAISGFLGFTSFSGTSFMIARWFAVIFVILFIITVIAHTIKKA